MRRFVVLASSLAMVLFLTATAIAQPANDDLGAPTAINALPFGDAVDTSDATVEAGEPVEGDEICPPRGATVWYALTLETNQPVAVDTTGSDYDTTLAVYTGSNLGDLVLVDCNDDTFFGVQAALSFDAEAGVTYLVQAGAFGGDFGGTLQISFDEPGRTTGKPVIFKSSFRGRTADASLETFDEGTGEFSFASANLVDGLSKEAGKPSKFSSLFVSSYSETVDEDLGTFTVTEWFGFADLSDDQFAIERNLTSAWVVADVTLDGQTCTGTFEGEEFECTSLGSADGTANIVWSGHGGIQKNQFKEKSTFDGTRFMFRGRFSSRNAEASGGLTGDIDIDFTGASGSLNQQSTGDFIMIRGGGLS